MGKIYEIQRKLPCPFLRNKTLACVDCRFCNQRMETCTNMEEIIDHIKTRLDNVEFDFILESKLEKVLKEWVMTDLEKRKIVIE